MLEKWTGEPCGHTKCSHAYWARGLNVGLFKALLLAATIASTANWTPAQAQTLQEQFDSASADATAGDCQNAVSKFEALESNPNVKQGSLPAAAIAVRKGICVLKLGAVPDETAVKSGLAKLAKAGGDFDLDVAEGWSALGNAAFARYDYAGATSAFENALEHTKGNTRLPILARLAKSKAFDGGTAALSYATEGIKMLSVDPKTNKEPLATFHTLKGRILLNRGDAQAAYTELKEALKLSGGLTSRTTLNEVSMRSDLAMAAMLVGQKDEARRYLAYTGAGRIEKSPFAIAASMNPPICGEETGLRPDDIAVVEFGIAEDGTVTSAHTVYSRGGPAVATAFGQAVSEWYWKPEDVAAIPTFYRLVTRVELRCSNVLGNGPGVMGPLRERFQTWAARQLLILTLPEASSPSSFNQILQKYADERRDPLGRLAAFAWLSDIKILSSQDRVAMADKALALAHETAVPQEVLNWLHIARLNAAQSDKRRLSSRDLDALVSLSNNPAISKDALAADTLRLIAARGWMTTKLKDGPSLLKMVAEDNRLPETHPLRQLAWLDLAGSAAADGNRTDAQNYFDKTGLTEEQCALLGEAPTLKRTNVSSADYPMEALWMGFEGWVRMEYDIQTDGKTVNARPLVAYPPLIFVDAATGMAEDLRYDVSFRPESNLACSAKRDNFVFRIPTNH